MRGNVVSRTRRVLMRSTAGAVVVLALVGPPTAPLAADEGAEAAVLVVAGGVDESGVVDELSGSTELAAGPHGTVQVRVTDAQRTEALADERVAHVLSRGTTVQVAIDASVSAVGAPDRWSAGYTGDGAVVAVIDTGVREDFGGALVGQACFAGDASTGYCGEAGGALEAYDDTCFELGVCQEGVHVRDLAAGRPCGPAGGPVPEACQHGSAVAAVAARNEAPNGVAPGAGVYAIRIFDPSGTRADLVDVYLALAHVRDLVDAGMQIAAVNLSMSTSQLFPGSCDGTTAFGPQGPALRDLLGLLQSRGVAPVVASGNSGSTQSLGFPACLSTAVAVGASQLDGKAASFSNRGPGLDLFAPGARSATSSLVIPSADGFLSAWSGTSFAAPHVAGGLAVLAEEYPLASVADRLWLLRAGGTSVVGSSVRQMGLGPPSTLLNGGTLLPSDVAIGGADRAAVVDLDGDGFSDVVTHGFGAARDEVAWGGPRWAFERRSIDVDGSAVPLVGDFTAPRGAQDVLWYAAGPASDPLLIGHPDRQLIDRSTSVRGSYQPEVGDFDGDGWDDLLWYAPGAAADFVWFGGSGGFSDAAVRIRGDYRLAVGDFDGDDRDDVLFHAPGPAADFLWRGQASRRFLSSPLSMNGSYTPIVGDFDGAAGDDILLYQAGSAQDYLWFGGAAVGASTVARAGFGQAVRTINGQYTPLAADLDGDGYSDVVWYQPGPGPDSIWFGGPGGSHRSRSITATGTYALRAGDFDGSGGDDLLWYHPNAASSPLWWSHPPAAP